MTRLRRSPASTAPVHDPAYQALKALVIARTGHHYYSDKDEQLWERLLGRLQATGLRRPADYLERLEGEAAAEGEWRLLESAITINETFFFRFAEQFDVLRRILLPRLLERAAATRRLRIWSVGCSIGAEPYSLAILIDELLGDAVADWRISILGTDIDQAALTTARAATYSSWSLRTLGADERERLFDHEAGAYRLKPRFRGLVRFEHHNMMTLLDSAAPLQFTDYDLILCRNVLIYFSQEVATRLVGALVSRLDRNGYLFVGHAEVSPEFAAVASSVDVGGVRAYQRQDAMAEPVPDAPVAAPIAVPAPPLRRAAAPERPPRRPVLAPSVDRAVPPPTALARVRSALSEGNAEGALRLAEAQAGAARRDPVPYYLAGLGALALGEYSRAEQGFRQALYLDNRFAMAHYLLGRHLLAQGRLDEGQRSLANALRVVAPLEPDTELPEGDGMTAGSLAAAVRSALR